MADPLVMFTPLKVAPEIVGEENVPPDIKGVKNVGLVNVLLLLIDELREPNELATELADESTW
jgi:hypothetical protein